MYLHLISAIFGIIAVVFAVKLLKFFGKIYKKSFVSTILGILFLTLSHLVETLVFLTNFSQETEDFVEHMLFNIGMFFLIVSFYTLQKSLGEFYPESKTGGKG